MQMKILACDIGTGTQDIFLFDSNMDLENCFKLVVPSPTMIVRRLIQNATRQRKPVLLRGVTMGGGPSSWAAEDHLHAGLAIFATPDAARTINDDLEKVQAMGIKIIGDEETDHLSESVIKIDLCDFNFSAIRQTFDHFGVSLNDLAAVAVAVFDHGAAPPEISDRQFRFDYLDQRIRQENHLSAFAYRSDLIPKSMTRLLSVAQSAKDIPTPLVVMDTAPAAVLGATLDPVCSSHERVMIANIGNFHTLAFRLGPQGIEGVFEHHTGLLDLASLEKLLRCLADSSLTNADVFDHHGHGALVYSDIPLLLDQLDFNLVVTGPRRRLLMDSKLRPYFPAPFGDMMITGCFGLLAATADVIPELGPEIRASLAGRGGSGTPPWEIG
jgi:uncharacterized protein (DUF1786 family)